MGKFSGILICTDLDGTLVQSDKSISRENLEAIEYFKREGGYFTFITGRMPYYASHIYETIKPNAPVGCANGGGLYDYKAGKYLFLQTLSPEALELVDAAEAGVAGIGFQANTPERVYFCKDNSAMEWFRETTGMPNLQCRHREVKEPIVKVVFGDKREAAIVRLSKLLREHPLADRFDFIRSEAYLYEILPKGISKGAVLPRLAEHLGIAMKKTVAVGDYNNDVSMLRAAGVGIAVANACLEAKEAADVITVSNDEHAIARIIQDVEMGKLQI